MAHSNHKGEVDWATVFGGVVPVVIHKVGRAEANFDEVNDVIGYKVSALGECFIVFKLMEDIFYSFIYGDGGE